jgi:hypothetical protein
MPTALGQLQGVPLSLLDEVERFLGRLAESPTTVSVRSAFPYRLDRQLYHFSVPDFNGKRWHFAVHFRYSQDEQDLVILSVVVREPS